MSTSGQVQYIRGYHYECRGIPCVHRRNIISTLEEGGGGGGILSTLGDVQHIKWILRCICGSNLINPFNFY